MHREGMGMMRLGISFIWALVFGWFFCGGVIVFFFLSIYCYITYLLFFELEKNFVMLFF
jgi:hypothetical protein